MQGSILKKTLKQEIAGAVDFLTSKGYTVISPAELDLSSVKSSSDLVDYFYSLLQFYNQGRDIHYSSSKKDIRLASNFIKSRQKISNLTKVVAAKEAAVIVKCVVKYEHKFKFKSPIFSFDCFGQDVMKWVTDRAISIINREDMEIERDELNLHLDRLYVEQEKEALNAINEDKIKKLDSILGGLSDGQEEKRKDS